MVILLIDEIAKTLYLGLIDAQYESDCKPPEDNGLIPTKATLIIVPSNAPGYSMTKSRYPHPGLPGW
jgi:hypothetical protein